MNAVAEAFRGIPGIENVETNPVTGCVILNYDPDRHDEFAGRFEHAHAEVRRLCGQPPETDLDELADAIENESKFLADHSAAARRFVELGKRLDREIKVASGNNPDLKWALAGGVVAATVRIGVTAATPVWITLLLFGTNHFVELHAQTAKRAEFAEDAR